MTNISNNIEIRNTVGQRIFLDDNDGECNYHWLKIAYHPKNISKVTRMFNLSPQRILRDIVCDIFIFENPFRVYRAQITSVAKNIGEFSITDDFC